MCKSLLSQNSSFSNYFLCAFLSKYWTRKISRHFLYRICWCLSITLFIPYMIGFNPVGRAWVAKTISSAGLRYSITQLGWSVVSGRGDNYSDHDGSHVLGYTKSLNEELLYHETDVKHSRAEFWIIENHRGSHSLGRWAAWCFLSIITHQASSAFTITPGLFVFGTNPDCFSLTK